MSNLRRCYTDRPVTFGSGGRTLRGMLHEPANRKSAFGMVFSNAFGEERKSSALAMARLARAIAEAGAAVLRFDYYGCGDGPGDFIEATVDSRIGDIAAAAAYLREECQTERLGLLGLRLGATLAVAAAGAVNDLHSLVLLEPIAEAQTYFSAELRRKQVREMITGGRSSARTDKLLNQLDSPDSVIDLDGYAIRGATYREFARLSIAEHAAAFSGSALLVQISFNDTVRAETTSVRKAFLDAGVAAELKTLVMPPFWSRIDVVDVSPLITLVEGWVIKQLGDPPQQERTGSS